MIAQLTSNWHVARILRLVMGVVALAYGIQDNDNLLGFAGAALVLLAVLNIGCCGANGCGTPNRNVTPHDPNRKIEFEEVK